MIENLLPNNADHVEALLVSYTVDNHVSMNADKLPAVENGVFILSCRVDDLGSIVLILVTNNFGKGVLDGWVVGINKVTIDKLYGEGALAYELC